MHQPDHSNVHALGMFIRFASKESTSNAFFEKQVGLPLIRKVGANADIYWAGECAVFEVVYVADKQVVAETDPLTAPALPVFRVTGMDQLLASLNAAGVTTTAATAGASGREAYFVDTDGYWIGLRERGAEAALPQDIEARRRGRRGEAYNPGCKSMPAGLQELGWVVRRVADLDAMTVFYRDVVGLTPIGTEGEHVLFDAGDNIIFELAPGGKAQPAPTDRQQAASATLFRVDDIARLRADLDAAGAQIVNRQIPLHWADLMYFADPEGTVLGAEQGYHPGQYAPEKFILAENLEANRRAREHAASLAE
ncbi:VOC family protein [Duganella sp. BuS-21]|uniref:VOC family protein n=1 Tax=Duganella sp. BuS-21 TaxID=2943848 RepID=UPI0035A617AB